MKTKWAIIIAALFLFACKEEFSIEFNTNEKILVIEGGITNKPGPYAVKLSTTLPVNEPIWMPFQRCMVTIFDNQGKTETLFEVEPGIYQTSQGGIRGTVGNEYSIEIETPEGKVYRTAFEKMPPPVLIDSVYAEIDVHEDLDYPFGLPGLQFYTDSKIAPDPESYVLWNMQETFQYETDYALDALYNFGKYYYANADMPEIIQITGLNYNRLFTCWKTDRVKGIYTGKTAILSSPKFNRQPLHFVGTDSKRLTIKYSLLLQQYTTTYGAHEFWENISGQISDENFLSTKQPFNVTGNVENVEDPVEMTFGYFTVASVDEKRVFFNRPNVSFYYERCYTGFDLSELGKKTQPVFLVQTEQGTAFVHKDCVDCRNGGGVPNMPYFWTDN